MQYTNLQEGCYMKIVVIRSPKLLAGMLRLLLGIRKAEDE